MTLPPFPFFHLALRPTSTSHRPQPTHPSRRPRGVQDCFRFEVALYMLLVVALIDTLESALF